jgi:hypothetical protein
MLRPRTIKEPPKGSFPFDFAEFIAFCDREVHERVRQTREKDVLKHSNPGIRVIGGLETLL